MADEMELKPCAHCGGPGAMQDAFLAAITKQQPVAYCPACLYSTPVEIWNTRTQSQRITELEDALRRIDSLALNGSTLTIRQVARSALSKGED